MVLGLALLSSSAQAAWDTCEDTSGVTTGNNCQFNVETGTCTGVCGKLTLTGCATCVPGWWYCGAAPAAATCSAVYTPGTCVPNWGGGCGCVWGAANPPSMSRNNCT